MKKNISKSLIILFFSILSLQLSAQIYIGDNVHNNENKRSYSILSVMNDKDLNQSLEEYLGKFGKIQKPEKTIYRITKFKNNISSDLSSIDVIAKSNKNFSKLEFFFLNDAGNALTDFELNKGEAEKFVNGFLDYLDESVEKKLIKENIANAESELKEAEKNMAKIRKAIENNLKAQEKLGKKLDSSPELLADAMAQRDDLNAQLSSSLDSLDEKSISKLNKASDKKDKEISKIEKQAQKAEKDLGKKEDELEGLKKDMTQAKQVLSAYQKALVDAKSFAK